jgi:hypothetical protein
VDYGFDSLACHDKAHQAFDVTYRRISSEYFWRGIYNDIYRYVASCHECQLTGPKKMTKSQPKLTSIVPPASIWSLVGIDLMGPYAETERGNKYVMVVKCYLSKFFIVRPLPNKQGATVALELFKIYCETGFVEAFISDQGGEFVNQVIPLVYSFSFLCS